MEIAANSRYCAPQTLASFGGNPAAPGAVRRASGDVGNANTGATDSGGFPAPRENAETTHVGKKNHMMLTAPWKQLMLRLCLFHSMLLERRRYEGLAWRRPYDFSAADLLSGVQQVGSCMD